MRRTILMLLAALVVLGSAQAFATSPEVTVAAARSRLVDYPRRIRWCGASSTVLLPLTRRSSPS